MMKNKSSKTAKLDRELFLRIGKGELPITGNAINFMLHTINFAAKDGRIYRKPYQVKKQLNMQDKTFKRVIRELKLLSLLVEKEGFYYSRFHVLANEEKENEGYVGNIKALNSDDILSLNIKKKRFFLYVASFLNVGLPTSLAVGALYKNKYHSGINYIQSYRELSKILFEFVRKGYFDVFIHGKKYDKNSTDFEGVFHKHCGYDQGRGKQRMTKRKNIIGIGVSKEIGENINSNQSDREEFFYYAEKNHIYHEILRAKTIRSFISVQNELFDKFGEVGVDLYRHAFATCFSIEQEMVLHYDFISDEKETKAVDVLMEFYLIKDVQEVIINVISGKKVNQATHYFTKADRLSELVLYFIQKSSDNQKILFDAELEVHGIRLSDLINTTTNDDKLNPWSLLDNQISNIYERIDLNSDTKLFNHKKIVREWAENGVLTREELIQQAVEEFKAKMLSFTRRERITANLTLSSDSNT